MNVAMYFCECGESYLSDTPYKAVRCLECQSVLKIENKPTLKQLSMFGKEQLKQLWDLFEKVTYDPSTEGITERFLVWQSTTNRFVIWLWFGEKLGKDFIDLPGKIVWESNGILICDECDCGEIVSAGQECYSNHSNGKVLCANCGKRKMSDLWLFLGYSNPWINQADDPFFNSMSFHLCNTVEELIGNIQKVRWNLGKSFVYKNLAFINQVDGGDEWLTIKDYCAIDSISFKAVRPSFIKSLLKREIAHESRPDYLNPVIQALL
ncbi:hypothetical protein BK120_22835 [Paenibacillus sp. FSL A5-0031]|uniref:hypothetical protein n=1 Tax=Paenibacillus sp. FSL A5-0031 TaxID=1920420 RepID=UPI00096DA1E5|nr:hypothetical protein [Paenibacillus sp. FSL A5-0031]OME78578.1 hypothetical protein BK120_22835 [Paenibacillus sp. FSL A5-0031]